MIGRVILVVMVLSQAAIAGSGDAPAGDAAPSPGVEPETMGQRITALEKRVDELNAKVDGGTTTKVIEHPQPPEDLKTGCGGDFGLLLPLFGISNRQPSRANPNQRSDLRITLPVDSGIGGGYYWPLTKCSRSFSLDFSVFGISEGLDPSKKFQIGGGGGFGLTVFGKFQFGLGLSMDLVREEAIETGGVTRHYVNGIFAKNPFSCDQVKTSTCMGRDLTLLITFSVTPSSGSPKPDTTSATH